MKKTILLATALIAVIAFASVFYNNYSKNDPSLLGPSGIYSELSENKNQSSAQNNTDSENTAGSSTVGNSDNTESSDVAEDSNIIPAMDFTVYDEADNAIKLSDFYGKPIVVNFWATWCGPCKSELPAFEQLYNKYGNDINFLMVNLTDGAQETVSAVREFISENDYDFPVYYDTELDAAMTYSVYSIPATLFIDADGNIVASHMGAMSESTLQNYIESLRIPAE